MKRLLATLLVVMAFGLAAPISASSATEGSPSVQNLIWARRLNFYYFGSSANPLLNGSCGKVFDGTFILTSAIESGQELHCTIPHGLPILASPAGSIEFESVPTPPSVMLARLDASLADITDRHATLDGTALPLHLVKSFVHPLTLQPGNLIQTVDPAVTGASTPVATGDWLTWIRHLSSGHHTLVLSDRFDGAIADITFHLTVR